MLIATHDLISHWFFFFRRENKEDSSAFDFQKQKTKIYSIVIVHSHLENENLKASEWNEKKTKVSENLYREGVL